jgi:hypothetical protein
MCALHLPPRPPPGGVLALDLARVTGWAWGHLEWPGPWFGTWQLPKFGGESARFGAFTNELTDALDLFEPDQIVVEAAIYPKRWETNEAAMSLLLGLRGILYGTAWHYEIPVTGVSASYVRDAMLGFSRIPNRPGAIKKAVKGWCERRGWRVPDDNAADAAMTWAWHQRQMRGPRQLSMKEMSA